MSRKKRPGPAFTIEESVPGDSRLTDVTYPPRSLLTSALKRKDRGLFVSSVVVTRNDSPVMLKTGDCLSPLPLVVFTTRVASFREGRIGYREWATRSGRINPSLDDRLDHDVDELMA
jgi:hypothetical protein